MLKRLLGVVGVVSIVAFVATFFFSPTVNAAGETYTWRDYSTIGASSGGYLDSTGGNNPGDDALLFIQDENNPAKFVVQVNLDDECNGQLILTFSASDKSKATMSAVDCDIINDIDRTVTVAGEATINTKVNQDSDTMHSAFKRTTCDKPDYTPAENEACNIDANLRYEAVVNLCRQKHDFTQYAHLANSYLDCLAEELGVERPIITPPEDSPETASTSCAIKNIGWIVCQVLQFVGWITDLAFDLLSSFLTVDPLKQYVDVETAAGTSQVDSPLYSAWKVMLGFANIIFVFVFIFIIFSYLTNQGLSNYNIKTLGPRLIIASLLVNLSFFICGIAVDLSNILGGTLRTTIVDMTPPSTQSSYSSWSELTSSIVAITPTDEDYNDKNNPNPEDDPPPAPADQVIDPEIIPAETTATLAGVGLVGGMVLAANLSVLIPFMAAVLAALITVLILLMVRQAVIICLIMIAPIAFALILLPNTKQWFDRWSDIFVKFLILYPAVSLIFGASYLASSVVTAQASQNSQSFVAMFALGIQLIPLFITPLVLKLSGGLLDRFAGVVNNPNKGPLDRMKNRAKDFRQDRKVLQQGRSASKGYSPDPNKGRARNAAGRMLNAAQTKNPNAILQRRKMRAEAAASAAESKLNESKKLAFNDPEAIAAAASGIKDKGFRDALIEESLAYAAMDLDNVEVGRVKAQVAQMDEAGVTTPQAIARAQTGRKEDGTKLTDIEHAAAMQKAANAATTEQAYDLIANSGSKSPLVRRALVDTLRKNGFSKENAHFGGAALNGVVEGNFNSEADIDNLMLGAIGGSKYGVTTLASQPPYVLKRLNSISNRTDANGVAVMSPALREKLRNTARTALATPKASGAIRGGEARSHLERLAL